MTLERFKDYVDGYGKQPGEYTRDDINEIILTYRDVSQADKCKFTWQNLAEYLGLRNDYGDWIKGETLRNRALELAKKLSDSSTEKDKVYPEKQYAPIMNLDNKLSEEAVNDITNVQLRELYKRKQQERDILNGYRRSIRDESRIDTLKDFIKDCVEKLNVLPTFLYDSPKPKTDKEAVLMFSDLHIGNECDNFYNKYNLDIAKARVNKLVNDTIEYCKNNKVVRLNVINLGDLIHGLIHTTARIEQQFDVAQQVVEASEIMAQALNKLQQAAPEVIYRSVVDNHSRMNADKSQHIEKESFCKLIDWYLQERLKNTKIKMCFDNLDAGLGYFELLNGKKIVFAHGHEDSINRSFQAFIGAKREFIDYALLGHYHSAKMKSFNDFTVFVNGSIVGTEEYALSRRLFTKPQQVLLIFDDDNVINTTINLNIQEV